MPRAFSATRAIDRPADQVWHALTDWEHAAGWLGVDEVRADGATRPGTQLAFRTRGRERAAEITEVRPGRALTVRSRQGGVTADYTYSVEPEGAGSRVSLVADVRAAGIWAPLGPVIRAAIRRTDRGQLDALDRALTAR
jgi:uncharacterized protein YndB with AHSA1/START domain